MDSIMVESILSSSSWAFSDLSLGGREVGGGRWGFYRRLTRRGGGVWVFFGLPHMRVGEINKVMGERGLEASLSPLSMPSSSSHV